MKIRNILKYIVLLVPAVVLICTACSGGSNDGEQEGPSPKFLLNGSEYATDNNNKYIYYSIKNDTEYAVGLTDTAKMNVTGTINDILSTYNGKSVTGIWRYGFANSKASTIVIPSSIKVIDFEGFMNSKITSVNIPASVTDIGEGAFYACKSINKVTIQNYSSSSSSSSACMCASEIEDDSGEKPKKSILSLIPSFCFFNCSELKELVLPESIEEVGYEAFNGCAKLYSTIAFSNIKTICSRAFQGCAALKNVYISSSFFGKEGGVPVGVIEDKAFNLCNSSLKLWLVGASGDVNDWLTLHKDNKWRWKDETTATTNVYDIENVSSGVSYSNDWIYTTAQNGDVTIQSYIGPTDIDGTPIGLITFPNYLPSGSTTNKVRKILTTALQNVKAGLKRIYLPKYLERIEPNMFDNSYSQLIVVDDNESDCNADDNSPVPRILLDGLEDLKVIGNYAFSKMAQLANITKLYLPYSLEAVGTGAFGYVTTDGKNGNHMRKVTDFQWKYDDEKSALKVIGGMAFYGLGRDISNKNITTATNHHQGRYNKATVKYYLTSLIIPRTFTHFGIYTTDDSTYNLGGKEDDNTYFGYSAFAGCPLISEVVFKGSKESVVQACSDRSTVDQNVPDLIIPNQTFVLNESLRTVVFEERCGKSILFHTGANKDKPAIGWSSGWGKNDFGGDPGIQTIVLPNRFTTIRMQQNAMRGNSRGVVYLTDTINYNTNFRASNQTSVSTLIKNGIAANSGTMTDNDKKWNMIGDESFDSASKNYLGYCFATAKNDTSTHTKNSFGLDQSMPIYTGVLYKQKIGGVDCFVGIGAPDNTKEVVVSDNCVFVTDGTNATLTKYLYDRYRESGSFNGTAVIPPTVTEADETTVCTVNKIGASAFSAAYCDETSYANDNVHPDLTKVVVPDTIEEVEEYAFMRAYGVTEFSSYNPATYTNASTYTSNGQYVAPSSLTLIGKHAFSFCKIQQLLKINEDCVFYENTVDTGNITSVFSNSFSLRKITFGSTGANTSRYYTTTTYGDDNKTSAIYSNNSVSKNKNSLLLVLNRNSADYLKTSDDVTKVSKGGDVYYSEFNGQYDGSGITQYIYGAYKMCYWLDSLAVSTPLSSSADQPLISGIYNVSGGKDDPLYLNNPTDFTGSTCNLKTISFTGELSTPPYSFAGCEKLESVKLVRHVGGSITAGLLSFVTNNNLKFEVPDDISASSYSERAVGVLDLTYTGYTSIGADAFKGTSINTFIAPITDEFTVGDGAFEDCTSLTTVNFSNVTNRVNLSGSFRGATIKDGIFNFGTSAKVAFGDETFKGCTFADTGTFVLPAKTALIGKSCFEESTIKIVTTQNDANLTELEVTPTTDTGENKNHHDIGDLHGAGKIYSATGFKQIGDYAFFHCATLHEFCFSKFTTLERIGHCAFAMVGLTDDKISVSEKSNSSIANTASICAGGVVELPASLTNIGVAAFYGCSEITKITIQSSTIMYERGNSYTADSRVSTNKGGHTFRWCGKLTEVFYTEPNCAWRGYYITKKNGGQDNYYSNCNLLTKIFMPTGYDLYPTNYTGDADTQRPDSMVYYDKTGLKIYLYHDTVDYYENKESSIYWHRLDKELAPLVYYVSQTGGRADLLIQENGAWKEKREAAEYWTLYDGAFVSLGTATVTSSTGFITFSNGYTLNDTTWTPS